LFWQGSDLFSPFTTRYTASSGNGSTLAPSRTRIQFLDQSALKELPIFIVDPEKRVCIVWDHELSNPEISTNHFRNAGDWDQLM
jgi:hypothetical protein